MAFTQLSDDLNIIQALSEEPNQTDGLSSAQLQAKFDEASGIIKLYINNTLIGELQGATGASSLGCSGTYNTIQDFINAMETAGAGSVPPDGSLSVAKFSASAFSTDGTLADNSDTKIASQKATKTYVDTKIVNDVIDTDGTLAGNSDTKVASQKATKTYAIPKTLLTTQGDLIYASASNTPARLGKSTAFKGLGMNSGATAPEWQDTAKSVLTASGDMLYASGANAITRLAKGTDGQILGLSSGIPAWENKFNISSVSGIDNSTTVPSGSYTKSISLGVTPKLVNFVFYSAQNSSEWFKGFVTPSEYKTLISSKSGTVSSGSTVSSDVQAGQNISVGNGNIELIDTGNNHSLTSIGINGTNLEITINNTSGASRTLQLRWILEVIY